MNRKIKLAVSSVLYYLNIFLYLLSNVKSVSNRNENGFKVDDSTYQKLDIEQGYEHYEQVRMLHKNHQLNFEPRNVNFRMRVGFLIGPLFLKDCSGYLLAIFDHLLRVTLRGIFVFNYSIEYDFVYTMPLRLGNQMASL